MGCSFLLHRIFSIQGSNLGLLHCSQILYHLSHQGSPIIGDAKVGSQEIPRVTGKFGLQIQNEAGQRLTVLPRQCAGPSKHLFQPHKRGPDGQYWNQIDYILYSWRWRSSIQSAKTRLGADCGSDLELLISSKVKFTQSCPTLCDPVDYTVYGILQARILKWVAFPFSRGSSQPRDWNQVSHLAGRFFTSWATRETQEHCSGVGSLFLL